ncbi:MAG: transglycosylase domain-containing protein, partial [Selenomonadaceae bacterium]|nr:transglycosylase domain-containing protein [Selenomonadaceae bacterium]
ERNLDNRERAPAVDDKKINKDRSSIIPVNNPDVGIFGRVERIFSIEEAVNERTRRIPHYVSLDEIPRSLQQAIVAVEDARFYSHSGFDVTGIARAAVVNVEAGEIEEGASTITQQLAKNLFLSSEQTFSRKAEELVLALELERNFSKDKIIEMYLNTIYFGSNFYGIYDASKGYFGKEPKDLTVGESAMLAGLPNAPSLYSPYVDFMLAKKRQLVVINAMKNANFLSERDAENARIEEIVLARRN